MVSAGQYFCRHFNRLEELLQRQKSRALHKRKLSLTSIEQCRSGVAVKRARVTSRSFSALSVAPFRVPCVKATNVGERDFPHCILWPALPSALEPLLSANQITFEDINVYCSISRAGHCVSNLHGTRRSSIPESGVSLFS